MNTTRVRVIEISGRVGFKARHVIVRIRRSPNEVAKVFVEVSFAIAVFIVQPRDLVTAENINLAVDYFEPERLVKTGSKAFPGHLLKLVVDAGDLPDIAVNRTHVSRAVAREIHA